MNQDIGFSQLLTDTLTLFKADGRVFENVKACVSGKGSILIEDVRLPIEVGDTFTRLLPSGLTDQFVVDDPGYCERFDMMPAHYQVKVHRANPKRPAPRPAVVENQVRFQVALSFPGQHRNRVEKIALTLADTLGEASVLYDKWHRAEFARPNLDVYLPKLYHQQARLLVFFLSSQFVEKEWCGLEWRAGRDLLKRGEDERLMFLRLDDADVPGLFSIDGYIDIKDLPDEEVANEILKRLGMVTATIQPPLDAKPLGNRPRVVSTKYGNLGRGEAVYLTNTGDPAYDLRIEDLSVGQWIVRFESEALPLLEKDGAIAVSHIRKTEYHGGSEIGSQHTHLDSAWRDAGITGKLQLKIHYRDWEQKPFRTICSLERDVLKRGDAPFRISDCRDDPVKDVRPLSTPLY